MKHFSWGLQYLTLVKGNPFSYNREKTSKLPWEELGLAPSAGEEDILAVKRQYFTKSNNETIEEFADTWFVKEDQLHLSAIQYSVGKEPIPNIGRIIDSKEFDEYKAVHPDAKPFRYGPEMKRQWKKTLDEVIVTLNDELR